MWPRNHRVYPVVFNTEVTGENCMMIVSCEEVGSPNFNIFCMFTHRYSLCRRALFYGRSSHCVYYTVMLITSKKKWRTESPRGLQHKTQGHTGLSWICNSTCFSRVPLVCKLVRADGWIHYKGQTEIGDRKLRSNCKEIPRLSGWCHDINVYIVLFKS